MAIIKTIWCNECGTVLENEVAARKHEERNCMPWEIGDPVALSYQPELQGTITSLSPLLDYPGKERLVWVNIDGVNDSVSIIHLLRAGETVKVQ